MKKNSSLWYGIGCTLVAVMLSALVFSFLVAPVGAVMSEYKENKALWDQIIKDRAKANAYNDRILLPQPPYITDNPINQGTYTGPCPIGTDGAPQLRQTGLSSGAECRGACGMDCPEERCKPIDEKTLAVNEGRCTYKNVISCNSHKGCRDHDACYDYCTEKAGDNSVVFGHCHGLCNQRCYDEYGYTNCFLWAALPGSVSSTVGLIMDVTTAPLKDKFLVYSDEPVFTPDSQKVTPTVAVNANTAYQWAILDSMQYSSDCSSWTYYADSRCNGAGWDGTCGQVPSQCVDTSIYRNGLKKEYTFTVVTQIDGNRNTYTVPKVDGWSITYDYAGNIVTAFRWKNGVQTDYCYGVGSRDGVPWDGVGGRDMRLDCEGPDGKSYTRESVSSGDP